ncbi:hypothetical protein D3C77_559340 [compost metagenome]
MASTVEAFCDWCSGRFTARTADRKRGWARFCSKSCKASKQQFGGTKAEWEKLNPNNRTSPLRKYTNRLLEAHQPDEDDESDNVAHDAFSGWDEGGWLGDDSGCSPIR